MAGGGWLLHIQGNIGDGGAALLCGVHSTFSPDSYRLHLWVWEHLRGRYYACIRFKMRASVDPTKKYYLKVFKENFKYYLKAFKYK